MMDVPTGTWPHLFLILVVFFGVVLCAFALTAVGGALLYRSSRKALSEKTANATAQTARHATGEFPE